MNLERRLPESTLPARASSDLRRSRSVNLEVPPEVDGVRPRSAVGSSLFELLARVWDESLLPFFIRRSLFIARRGDGEVIAFERIVRGRARPQGIDVGPLSGRRSLMRFSGLVVDRVVRLEGERPLSPVLVRGGRSLPRVTNSIRWLSSILGSKPVLDAMSPLRVCKHDIDASRF